MLRRKIILLKILLVVFIFMLVIIACYNETVKIYGAFVLLALGEIFSLLFKHLQKCPKCKKMIGNRYAIANGEEKFFWLFPKKCPYCGEPFVSEKKKK